MGGEKGWGGTGKIGKKRGTTQVHAENDREKDERKRIESLTNKGARKKGCRKGGRTGLKSVNKKIQKAKVRGKNSSRRVTWGGGIREGGRKSLSGD